MNYKIINGTLLMDDGVSVTLKKGEEIFVRDGRISFSESRAGLGRKELAAAFTAFISEGV